MMLQAKAEIIERVINGFRIPGIMAFAQARRGWPDDLFNTWQVVVVGMPESLFPDGKVYIADDESYQFFLRMVGR